MGAGAGVATAMAAHGVSNTLHHKQQEPHAGSGPSFGASLMNHMSNAGKPRLIIHAATFCDADITQKVRNLVKDDQTFVTAGDKLVESFEDPWPESGKHRGFVVLYQYGERPMEVLAAK
jgi:hypothetical protein